MLTPVNETKRFFFPTVTSGYSGIFGKQSEYSSVGVESTTFRFLVRMVDH